jgi:poly(A) polymerase
MNYTDLINFNPVFRMISQAAGETETYVVGGFVRDMIMRKESKDIDVVCIGSGIDLAKKVTSMLPEKSSLNVFKNFGTAQVKMRDLEIEFVGARKESYRQDSRKPIVEDGTLEDDQLRRDFTINALAISLNKDRFGELIDPLKGKRIFAEKSSKRPPILQLPSQMIR